MDVHKNFTAIVFTVQLDSAHNFSASVCQDYGSVRNFSSSVFAFSVSLYRSMRDLIMAEQITYDCRYGQHQDNRQT